MAVQISALVPEHSLPIAATFMGIRGASQSGIIRTALALFHGHIPGEAIGYAGSGREYSGRGVISATVPEELMPADDINKSWAVRVGLGIAAGLSREQAESWARMQPGPAKGTKYRPRSKATTDEP